MPSIKSITQASRYIAAYAVRDEKEERDRFEDVICWSVIEFDEEDEPDEVVGQIFDGTCITEASSVGEEEGYGEFVGYFNDRAEALRACEAYRQRLRSTEEEEDEEGDEEEDEDEPPKKKKKNKKKEVVGEEEDEEEGEEDEDDDFSSWEDDD